VDAIRRACVDAAGWLFVKYALTPERFESAVAKNAPLTQTQVLAPAKPLVIE
jgi:hypothetical protein